MPSITYNDFSGGLDRRLPINVQEASRLWILRNAYITLGKRIKKRPCLKLQASFDLTNSFGLETVNGQLAVFTDRGVTIDIPGGILVPGGGAGSKPLMTWYELDKPVIADASVQFLGVNWADIFQGYPYVVARYKVTYSALPPAIIYYRTKHHYLDTNPNTLITDTNCPHSASVTKAAGRIFAINGETVRYSAVGAARDWTTSSDAGFLPTGLQQDTKEPCTAVGTFQDSLVVFYSEGAQIWNVATDPSANSIRKRISGVGCSFPQTQASWASDLSFLSTYGFRSMTVTQNTDRIDDTDIGVPIDPLVVADIKASSLIPESTRIDPFGAWIPQLGQYWCIFDSGTSSKVWAYSYSRSSKVACWSEYTLPVRVTGLATLGGTVYLRTDSQLYTVDASAYTDNGVSVPVEVQMAFQDAKSPGILKQFIGADYVMEGSATIAFKHDPRSQTKETIPQLITGDTRPDDLAPVEVCATALAPVFRHEADEAFEMSQATFYYFVLGAVG